MPSYLYPGVYVQEIPSGAKPIQGVSTSTAVFVGEAQMGRASYPTLVTSWLEFQRVFGDLDKTKYMPLAVYQFFQNGGQLAYILRVLPSTAVAASVQIPTDTSSKIEVQAAGAGAWGNSITIDIQPSVNAPPNYYDWTISTVVGGQKMQVELFANLGVSETGDRFYATVINRDSNYIEIVPDSTTHAYLENAPTPGSYALQNGQDVSPPDTDPTPTATDYTNALLTLNPIDDASILVIPGATEDVATEGASYVANTSYRPLGDMFYIMDSMGSALDTRDAATQISDVTTLVDGFTQKNAYTGIYFPWVEIPDPYSTLSGATRFAPPSGMIAGLFARTDATRGVWKAPAGTEASLLGVVGVAAKVTDTQQGTLNPKGVNCIRQFAASGIVVWGARTLATQSNPEYRYVPVRRMTSFLKVSLYQGTQWVVFEPNDAPLWSAIRFNVNAFMLTQFRAGAFQGTKADDAFHVVCDATNNPQASIDAGQVNILVAFAPLKPAEFVIIQIQQLISQ